MARLAGFAQVLFAAAVLLEPQGAGSQPVSSATASSHERDASALRARGLELGYNLDYEQALDAFRDAIAADPTHPAGYRLTAATMWINALLRQGAVTADDYLGQVRSDVTRQPMPPDLDRGVSYQHRSSALARGTAPSGTTQRCRRPFSAGRRLCLSDDLQGHGRRARRRRIPHSTTSLQGARACLDARSAQERCRADGRTVSLRRVDTLTATAPAGWSRGLRGGTSARTCISLNRPLGIRATSRPMRDSPSSSSTTGSTGMRRPCR